MGSGPLCYHITYFIAWRSEKNPKKPTFCMKLPLILSIVDCFRYSNDLVCLALENHREESSFQNHLTAKVLVVRCYPWSVVVVQPQSGRVRSPLWFLFPQFTFFNYFAVLFHIAFFKQDVPLLRKVTVAPCVTLVIEGEDSSQHNQLCNSSSRVPRGGGGVPTR